MTKTSIWHKYQFWLLLVLAIIIRQLPLVSIPFNWLESYFHEISHGIAALITGGQIVKIELFTNGAGLCTTQGGWRFLISFMGYAGATFWGASIYLLASVHKRIAQMYAVFIFVLIISSIIFWVRDLLTLFILLLLAGMFFVTIRSFSRSSFSKEKALTSPMNNTPKKLFYLQKTLQLFGLLILLNSLFSPLNLLDGRHIGDGATLATLTMVPEIVWVGIWCALAIAAIYSLSKRRFS